MIDSLMLSATRLSTLATEQVLTNASGFFFQDVYTRRALVGVIGVMLIFGAFSPQNRVCCAMFAAASKAIFVVLVLLYGQQYLATAAPAVALDLLVIVFTLLFLLATRRRTTL